jgi:hypothetical protein
LRSFLVQREYLPLSTEDNPVGDATFHPMTCAVTAIDRSESGVNSDDEGTVHKSDAVLYWGKGLKE